MIASSGDNGEYVFKYNSWFLVIGIIMLNNIWSILVIVDPVRLLWLKVLDPVQRLEPSRLSTQQMIDEIILTWAKTQGSFGETKD